MKLWKALGLAGLAGVAATGAIIARDQRQRAQLTPDEVRERLRRRVEANAAQPPGDPAGPGQAGRTESSARA
jgi:hypothetical protein